jgi:hypothetical protein
MQDHAVSEAFDNLAGGLDVDQHGLCIQYSANSDIVCPIYYFHATKFPWLKFSFGQPVKQFDKSFIATGRRRPFDLDYGNVPARERFGE